MAGQITEGDCRMTTGPDVSSQSRDARRPGPKKGAGQQCAQNHIDLRKPFISNGVGYVPISNTAGKRNWFAMVSLEDFERVSRIRWRIVPGGRTFYARAVDAFLVLDHQVMMQNYVMGVEPDEIVDHKDSDGLNNTRSNLRPCTDKQNQTNTLKTNGKWVSSKFKGVSRSGAKWSAQIGKDGEVLFLGSFDTEEEAARAYDKAATQRFGEFAKTNADMGLFENPEPVRRMYGAVPEEADPVVAIKRHHRTKAILYLLRSGRMARKPDYKGRHPTDAEAQAMIEAAKAGRKPVL